MSFMSANDIFEPVVRELVVGGDPDDVVFRSVRALIEVLTERGWDDVEGSLALFDHPSVLRAANDLGYYAYDQIPDDGALSTAKIRCKACKRLVAYRRDEEGDVHSEIHTTGVTVGVATVGSVVCPYAGKGPNGY